MLLNYRRDNIFTENLEYFYRAKFSPENGLKKLHAPNLYNNKNCLRKKAANCT